MSTSEKEVTAVLEPGVKAPEGVGFDLDHFLPYLLTRTTNRLSLSFAGALRPLRMTNHQWRVLATLAWRDGRTLTELCAYTAVDHSTLSRTVQRMEEDGLVKRSPCESDARSLEIRITEAGLATFQQLLPIAMAQYEWAVRDIGEEELEAFVRTLRKILQNIRLSPYP